jgi:hypothetical protein
MTEWIFTFGFAHVHPETGQRLANHYVVIKAEDGEAAREEMVRRFGRKWAFQYRSREHAGVERWGLVELED